MNSFSTELRTLRLIQLNWSQLRLAKAMGVSQSVISSIENGLCEPTKKFQEKLDKVKKQQKVKIS